MKINKTKEQIEAAVEVLAKAVIETMSNARTSQEKHIDVDDLDDFFGALGLDEVVAALYEVS